MAAGFSLPEERFDAFAEGMERYAMENHDLMPQATCSVDKALTPEDLTVDAIRSLDVLEPFGAKNEEPVFLLQNAVLEGITPLSGGKHVRLSLRANGKPLAALSFGMTPEQCFCRPGDRLDLVVNADINEYNGIESVSLKIKDMRCLLYTSRCV